MTSTRIAPRTSQTDRRQMYLVPSVPRREYRPVLVDTNMAMEQLGYDLSTIQQMREAGEIRWAWDVSVRQGKIRAIRYWAGELIRLSQGDMGAQRLPIEQVLSCVVGHETQRELRGTTVGNILLLRGPTIKDLHDGGELRGRVDRSVRWIERASLVEFLHRRLIS